MIHKISKWYNRNEDIIVQVYAFGFATVVALSMMALSYIL